MSPKTWIVGVISGLLLGSIWFNIATAGESKTPAAETLKIIGPTLAKAYTSVPVHPDNPDHLWLDESNDRVLLLMFNKPVSDPKAQLLFVGEGIKGRFCAESQPDRTGYIHFHRSHTPDGDHSMSGPKDEEGYWLKHVAVSEFDMDNMHHKPRTVQGSHHQPTTPKCE